jgi:hypothetical protein
MARKKKSERQATFPMSLEIPETELGGVEPDEPEWKSMWDRLAAVTGDADRTAEDPESGESWQYMCSFRYTRDAGGVWLHEFRHRFHPRVRERWVLHLPATPGWSYRPRTAKA